jgi:lactate racemase
MNVEVKYGEHAVSVTIPNEYSADVIYPEFEPGVEDESKSVRNALTSPVASPPLSKMLEGINRLGIIFSDVTRATPNRTILPPILKIAAESGITDDRITLFNATGTHRTNTPAELTELLGESIARRYEIVQNVSTDRATLTRVGKTSTGNEVYLNKRLIDCDLRILTGYIEPHFFAGYSGGGKAIMPGCAGTDTILWNHGAINIDDPHATWGELDKNPIAREVLEAAHMAGPSFLVNVTLNRDRNITAVFAGNIEEAHRNGCDFVARRAIRRVNRLYDLVITSNAGYPLDRNLYQTVKGMSAAARIVKPGGAILALAECRDGIPEEGNFGRMLASENHSGAILDSIRSGASHEQDVWQAQVICKIAEQVRIYLYSDKLSEEKITGSHCIPVSNVDETIAEILASTSNPGCVCVLPEGPETIPVYPNPI